VKPAVAPALSAALPPVPSWRMGPRGPVLLPLLTASCAPCLLILLPCPPRRCRQLSRRDGDSGRATLLPPAPGACCCLSYPAANSAPFPVARASAEAGGRDLPWLNCHEQCYPHPLPRSRFNDLLLIWGLG